MTPPGTKEAYQHPYDSSDTQLDPEDWVQGVPGVKNAKAVRSAMDALIGQTIVVPVWSSFYARGSQRAYLTSDFAEINLLSYSLAGNGTMTFEYQGMANCYNTPPVVRDLSVETQEDTAVGFQLEAVDAEGDELVYTITEQPLYGAISGTAPELIYSPSPDFNGSDELRFSVTDGEFTVEATVNFAVAAVNDVPVIETNPVQTSEDQAVSGAIQASDVDGDTLTYSIAGQPENGQLSLSGEQFTYTPAPDYNGADRFSISVSDGEASVTAVYSVTVTAVNDAPVVTAQPINTDEDQPVSGTIQASDVDGDALVYAIQSPASLGQVELSGGQYTYSPAENQYGTDSFVVAVSDGQVSVTAEYSVIIAPVNDAPVVSVSTFELEEDQPLSIAIDANDVDGDALTYSLSAPATKGTVVLSGAQVTYTPDTNANGPDSFTIEVSDGSTTVEATYSVTITPVNDAPVAEGQDLTLMEDTELSVTLSGSDVDGDDLVYTVVSQPANGVLSGTAPELVYTPNPDFSGEDSFGFTANDGELNSVEAVIKLSVTAVNDAPVIQVEPVTLQEDQPVSFAINAVDADGDTLSYSLQSNTVLGTASLSGNTVTYTPAPNANGVEQLQVAVSDGTETVTATYTLTIEGQNDAPVASSQDVATDEDAPISITLSADDVDGDALSYQVTQQPTNGTISGSGQTLSYTPNTNFNGLDAFSFVANDGTVSSNEATVTITVNSINDRPVAESGTVAGDEDTVITGTVEASDADGDALTYSIATTPANGQLELSDNQYSYIPNLDDNGNDQFVIRVSDGQSSALATISVTVLPVNDAPVAYDQNLEMASGESLAITLEGSDVDGDVLSFKITAEPETGELTGVLPNLIYTADEAFSGTETITYSVSDDLFSAAGQITISVTSNAVPPEIISTPDTGASENSPYLYDVELSTNGGEGNAEFFLTTAPEGMTIDSESGIVFWLEPEQGQYTVEVSVVNQYGLSTSQSYILDVGVIAPDVSYFGREFWLAFGANYNESTSYPVTPKLFISTTETTTGYVEIPGLNYRQDISVVPGQVTIVDLSDQLEGLGVYSRGIHNTGVYVKTEAPSAVYFLNQKYRTTDAALVYPIKALGREYYASSIQSVSVAGYRGSTLINIVATEDNTLVGIELTASATESEEVKRIAGNPYHINLNKGDVYQLYPEDYEFGDFTGSKISSDRPVAVFSGNKCAAVYAAYCDHLIEQMPPVNTWGTIFYTAPFATRKKGDPVRILAERDGTFIKLNDEYITLLNKGEYFEELFVEPTKIQTNYPVLVTQFSTGGDFDSSQRETPSEQADPFMLVVPPFEQYLDYYVTSTPTESVQYNYVNIFVPESAKDTVTMDGVALTDAVWMPVGDGKYVASQYEIQSGEHVFEAEQNFGLISYGYGKKHESYGFVAGQAMSNQREAASLDVALTSPNPQAGDEVCIIAEVVDEQGLPIVQSPIFFDLENAVIGITESISSVTSATGTASHCYARAKASIDQVLVSLQSQTASVSVNWGVRQSEENAAPIIHSVPVLYATPREYYEYQVLAIDPEGEELTYTLDVAPEGMSVDPATGLVSWMTYQSLDYTSVAIRVSDQSGGETLQKYRLSHTPGSNRAPVIVSGQPDSVIEKHAFSFVLDIDELDGDRFHARLLSGPEGLKVSSWGYGASISWRPETPGEYKAVIEVTDQPDFWSVTQELTIVVTPNSAPVLRPQKTPDIAIVNHPFEFHVHADDADGDLIRFKVVDAPDGMTVASGTDRLDENGDIVSAGGELVASGKFKWTPGEDQLGTHTVNFVASDYDFLFGPDFSEAPGSFEVTVVENQPPEVSPVPELNWISLHRYFFRLSATDPDDVQTFFSLVSGPLGLTVDSSGYVRWTPAADQSGSHDVTIMADDHKGGITNYTFQINVAPNQAPVITSTSPLAAAVGQQYTYSIGVFEPEGDSYTISPELMPSGMAYNSFYKRLYWTPDASQIGDHTVKVTVSDKYGAASEQEFTLPVTDQLVFTQLPTDTVVKENEYYVGYFTAAETGATVKCRVVTGPAGFAVPQYCGRIRWRPDWYQVQPGSYDIELEAEGSAGQVLSHSFQIRVLSEFNAPEFESQPVTEAYADGSYQYQVVASDVDGDAVILGLVNGPEGMTLSPEGLLEWLPGADDLGTHNVSIEASDGSLTTTQDFLLTVSLNDEVVVSMENINDHDVITAPTGIIGTVTDSNLLSWRLSYQRQNGRHSEWVTFAEGTEEQTSSVLATFDPTLLKNGQYLIQLEGVDQNGPAYDSRVVQVAGNLKVGNFSFTIEDLNIPMSGIPMSVSRTYDTRQKSKQTDLGYGWTFDYQNVEVDESRNPATQWSQNEYPTGPLGTLINYCIEPIGAPVVSVTLPNGDVERFDVQASNSCNLQGGHEVQFNFQPQSGTLSKLTQSQYGNLRLVGGNLVDALNSGEIANPRYYTLTTQAGFAYELDETFGVTTITDPNGNTITYSDDGIFHSDGKAITFSRDSEGRVTTVTDPAGNSIEYAYSSIGDLVTVTDLEGGESTYTYFTGFHVHMMDEMKNAYGRKVVKNLYDASGRLVAQEDGDGNRTEFNHDLDGRLSVITDRLGRITQHRYDDRGNILSTVDALGNVAQYTYDEFDNQLTVTNALGETTTATYDNRRNQLTQTDALGNTVAFEYNLRGQETKITDARGNVFENIYDSFGNLLQVVDPQGNATRQTINEKGLVASRTDAEGNVTTFEYDSEGNVTKETAADGSIKTYTYDANNNRLTETLSRTVNGEVIEEITTYVYDAQNRVVQVTDAEGNISQTQYDLLGNVTKETAPGGYYKVLNYDDYGRLLVEQDGNARTTKAYDLEGNLITETDPLGQETIYIYDALNRLIKTTYPDGSNSQIEYDAAGRVVAEIDENGNRTEHSYDAAGRRIQTTDALGNVYRFEYDADGNLVKEIDPKGNETVHSYDSLDHRNLTTFADGKVKQTIYDALGRITAEVDEAGIRTEFTYDELGRLTQVKQGIDVVDATTATEVSATTAYTYDEAGNKLTQTDAEGRTTRWTYDAIGRVSIRQLPMGQVENFRYRGHDGISAHTDFNNQVTAYSYTRVSSGYTARLAAKNYADGDGDRWTYDAKGRMISATTVVGGVSAVTNYTYDNRDRLLTETKSDGSVLSYSYDNVGNKLSFTLTAAGQSSGITTTYTYDALNRLKTVTDHKGHSTTYSYDANGNRESVSHSNGLSTEYSYDARNRLTQITHKDVQGNTLKQYSYTLHATGRREKISENTGRVTDYSYDSLYRLTKEVITDAVNGNHSSEYSYDKVGNRTQSIINGITTAYSYDANDRLTQSGGSHYEYDNNGNTTKVTLDSDVTTYTYNAKNKLTAASITEGGITKSMAYTYDIDGNRVTSTVDGTTTVFLVDNNQDYAQVVQESQNGSPSVTYTFGDDLISQDRSGQSSFYHYDGLGSTRALSDSTGNVTDSYDYEAFGELLNESGSTENSYLYTGEQYDEGLDNYYLRARYMDTSIGRFTQMDTYQGRGMEPATLHKYLYTHADPINNTDPTGKFTIGQAMTAKNIMGTLAVANSGYSGYLIGTGGTKIYEGRYKDGAKDILFGSVGFMGSGVSAAGYHLIKFAFGPVNAAIRNKYLMFISTEIPKQVALMTKQGRTQKHIAEVIVTMRNSIKMETRALMAADGFAGKLAVKILEVRNIFHYRNPLGPTAAEMVKNGKNYGEIVESALRTNATINKIAGSGIL